MTQNVSSFPAYGTLFLKSLEGLQKGSLTLKTPCGQIFSFKSPEPDPHVTLELSDWSTIKRMLNEGDIGFAKDYFKGTWTTDNLPNLLALGVWNEAVLQKYLLLRGLKRFFYRCFHLFQPNSKAGSQKNIQAHYDLSNDFFRLWLDESMTYSSALFEGDFTLSLTQAQHKKYARLLDSLQLPVGSHILEVGCGWGGFMSYGAQQGYQVTGITISPEQYNFVKSADPQAQVKFQDYRDTQGQYDGIVSIEMFEAVGERYWPVYFKQLKACLKPGGKMMIQTILIEDSIFKRYRKGSDFIQLFSFPGGLLPSQKMFDRAAAQAGLKTVHVHPFALDYAETLRRWSEKLMTQRQAILDLGFTEEFLNMWHYYFSYCIAGFQGGRVSVAQIELHHAA